MVTLAITKKCTHCNQPASCSANITQMEDNRHQITWLLTCSKCGQVDQQKNTSSSLSRPHCPFCGESVHNHDSST